MSRKPRTLLAYLLLGGLCSCSQGPSDTRPGMAVTGSRAEAVAGLLEAMPDWQVLDADSDRPKRVAEIERTVREIAAFDIDDIRSGMHAYYYRGAPNAWQASDGKLLVLVKFLFNLPDRVRRDSPHFKIYGGWWGLPITGDPHNPKPSDEMLMRWPWTVGKDGQWHLTGRSEGYSGPAYQVFDEFDFYRKTFGRRAIPGAGK